MTQRVALVTGAGQRVGAAIARALGASGMHVAVHYHESVEGARQVVAAIETAGGRATAFAADLTTPDAPAQLIGDVVASCSALHLLVNSAAMMERTPIGEVSADQWDAMFALNLRAPFLLSQAAAPALAESHGSIVNIADLAAFETWPAYVPHSITKAGIVQMTRGLARALAPHVRVNAVAPGAVLLPEGWSEESAARLQATTPLGRLGTPEDVADAVLYLAGAEFVTGETLIVDGGRHIRS